MRRFVHDMRFSFEGEEMMIQFKLIMNEVDARLCE